MLTLNSGDIDLLDMFSDKMMESNCVFGDAKKSDSCEAESNDRLSLESSNDSVFVCSPDHDLSLMIGADDPLELVGESPS